MAMTLDNVETDTRTRILVSAERLFREIGYQKTTVADIAKALRMSPANVYRFFDSKKSIHEAVACRLMNEVETAAQLIALGAGDPSRRLRDLLRSIHLMNVERFVGDAKIHEMVAMAMEEDWDVCVNHMQTITGSVAHVIGSGIASGDFAKADVELAAMCVCTAMNRFFHPQIIAQCAEKPGPTLDEMIEFVIAGLRGSADRKVFAVS